MRGLNLLVPLCLMCTHAPVHAGAWALPVGERLSITTAVIDDAPRAFDNSGEATLDSIYEKRELRTYTEWGLTPDWTAVAKADLQTVRFQGAEGPETYTGTGETGLGLRRQFRRTNRGAYGLQGMLSYFGGGEAFPDGELGETVWQAEARALAGRNFGPDVFVDAQAAYRLRFDGAPDGLQGEATLGWRAAPRWTVLGQLSGETNLSVADGRRDVRTTQYLKGEFSVLHRLTSKYSLQLGGFRTLAGRNAIREEGVFVGLWVETRPQAKPLPETAFAPIARSDVAQLRRSPITTDPDALIQLDP